MYLLIEKIPIENLLWEKVSLFQVDEKSENE